MKRLLSFALMVLAFRNASAGEWSAGAINSVALNAVRACEAAFLQNTGRTLVDDIDHANVDFNGAYMVVLFSHGESGSFGRRTPSYASSVSCAFNVGSKLTLKRMMDGGGRILIGNDAAQDDAYVRMMSKEYFGIAYLREMDEYSLLGMKSFRSSDIEIDGVRVPKVISLSEGK